MAITFLSDKINVTLFTFKTTDFQSKTAEF